MSVPFIKGYNEIEDIINKLKAQNFNYTEINQVIKDLRGTRRKEEIINFLIANKNNKLTINDVLEKKKEIFERYDEMWGYIPQESYTTYPFEPLYDSVEYMLHEKEYTELHQCMRKRILSSEMIKELFEIRNEIFKNNGKNYEKVWEYIWQQTDKTKNFFPEIYLHYCENRLYVNNVLHTYGSVEDNDKKLKCSKCKSIYVGMHLCFSTDNKTLKNIGLYDNPIEYYSNKNNAYYCLSCGNEW